MNPVLTNSIVVAALSGLVSGLAVALLNYFLGKRRTEFEIQNIRAQTDKARAETEKILAELKNVSATVSYTFPAGAEQLLIDGKQEISGFDVVGAEGQYWEGLGSEAKPIGPKAEGFLRIDSGVMNVQRTNTLGKFELNFHRYLYKGREYTMIPKDDLIPGKRRLLASCEAKTVGGEHSLRFVIRNPKTGLRLAQSKVRVTTNEWMPFQAFLAADPSMDSQFRIDDEEVSEAPSSVQIRNVTLAQRD